MVSTATKVFFGLGCAVLLGIGLLMATCAGCATMMMHQAGSSSAPATESPSPDGGWKGGEQARSEMDSSRTVLYHLAANGPLVGWLHVETPSLVAVCREGKTEAYLETGMPLNPELGKFHEYTVRLRFDDGAPRTERWNQSTDDKAVFSPHPVAFLKQLAKAKTLKVEVTPFNASPGVATFYVAGFAGPLGKISTVCKWR